MPKRGWFIDPSSTSGQERWWDGKAWSELTRPATGESKSAPMPLVEEALVTTLPSVPGYRITETLGVVTNLSANSGWTATSKGNTALYTAIWQLRTDAALMGANAIVGMVGSSFGAHGGITNIVGGDAVGILLLGTAVVVEAIPNRD